MHCVSFKLIIILRNQYYLSVILGMGKLDLIKNPAVHDKFRSYPKLIKPKIKYLRSLILEAAEENEEIYQMEETLKWGEPSYLVKKGSTVRIDWKERTPDQYAIYFKCTSKLVPTFKELYGDTFKYEGNRALIFGLNDKIPKKELKVCIELALRYHKVKDKPLLGKKK